MLWGHVGAAVLRSESLTIVYFALVHVCRTMVLSVWYDENYQRFSHDGLHSYALMRPLKLRLTMLTVASSKPCTHPRTAG